MRHGPVFLTLFLITASLWAQKPDEKGDPDGQRPQARKTSAVARENPVIREYFLTLYQPNGGSPEGNDTFRENLIDRQIDSLVEQTFKRSDEMLQRASSVRQICKELQKEKGKNAPENQRSLAQTITLLKRTRALAEDLQGSLAFIFSAVRVKKKTELKIPGFDDWSLVQSYSTFLYREVEQFNDRIETFFFSARQEVSIETLQNEGMLDTLARVVRLSERMEESIRQRLLAGN